VIRSDFFSRESEMDGLAGLAFGAVPEHDHIEYFVPDKAGLLQRGGNYRKVVAANE